MSKSKQRLGRPPLLPEDRHVKLSASLSPEGMEALMVVCAKAGVSRSEALDIAIQELARPTEVPRRKSRRRKALR